MILRPQTTFTIVRQIEDHTDPATYYVRAVIRNAYSDTIIATVNLNDKGSQRFTYNWTVPNDPGNGLWVSIITSVYTDSGYTTKSPSYGDHANTYLVERLRISGGGGTGWAPTKAYYKEIADALRGALAEIPEREPVQFDTSRLEKAIQSVASMILPMTKRDDVAQLKVAIANLERALTKPSKDVDMSPVFRAIDQMNERMATLEEKVGEDTAKIYEKIDELSKVDARFEPIKEQIGQILETVTPKPAPKPRHKPSLI